MLACFNPFRREAEKQNIHDILKRIQVFYINWLFFLVTQMIFSTSEFHKLTTNSCTLLSSMSMSSTQCV